jgi:DNA-binding CsgD family transcriptional regulator
MDALSKREMEVLNWFLRGFGTATIGVRLHVSTQTVRNHLKNVCKKLEVRSQIELRELFAQGA